MDELTIEGKKYVSSKQAAKLTGYAKDYIGQLCREGRVRARLVGRSWYVLESSIKNHKFGDESIEKGSKSAASEIKKVHYAMPSTWKEPKYEAVAAPVIPEIAHKAQNMTVSEEKEEKVSINITTPKVIAEAENEAPDTILDLKETWRGWFSANKEIMPEETELPDEPLEIDDTDDVEEEIPIQIAQEPTTKVIESTKETVEVSSTVPIHAIYAPLYSPTVKKNNVTTVKTKESTSRISHRNSVRRQKSAKSHRYGFLVTILVIIALGSAALAAISTGYFDKYSNLFPQAHYVSGITNYVKP